jgi:hypothetical protein
MKGTAKFFMMLIIAALIAAPLTAQAVENKSKSEVVMKAGKKVHLFHSGTAAVEGSGTGKGPLLHWRTSF